MTTPPRQVLPGTVYLVTRRCAQREFLLKPTELTTAIFKYVLAVAAQRCRIRLHAACVLSNHYHLVLSDPRAALPRFCQLLDGLLARVLNASYGRWESFWAPASYSAVELVTPEDVVEKIAYTLANPVAAGLVSHGEEWPGLRTPPEQIGGASELVARPEKFFSPTGTMPERAELTFRVPAACGSPDEFRTALRARLSRHEREAHEALAAKGERFLGLRLVHKQKRTGRPATRERRRKLNPRVACHDPAKRMKALDRLMQFRDAYRAALERLRSGALRVIFPAGTYLLRVHLGIACAAP
jgi:REP element-mobilizing transposase RayT